MPIKSILLLTHNIEEAGLMRDRIIILSSNPGRIAAEIEVGLPHPRNRLDPAFRQFVDRIYTTMTQRTETEKYRGKFPGMGIGMALTRISNNTFAGMMEEIATPPYNGKADIPAVTDSLHMEIDDLLPVAEALQLLRFVEIAEGDIALAAAGKRFADADTDTRKSIFREHLLTRFGALTNRDG
jgi:NitT/TauT family transport system ATP-binding protein